MTEVSIRGALGDFDGRDTGPLESLRAALPPTPTVRDALIEITRDDTATMQVGATWLLKAYLQDGYRLDGGGVARLGEALASIPDGLAALHLCQSVQYFTIPDASAEAYAVFATRCLNSSKTFVRAWATDALHRIAVQHPRFSDRAGRAVARALADPAPSIRARARRITEER